MNATVQTVDAALSAAVNAGIDRLFAGIDRPDHPGGALAIVRHGEVLYQRCYGLANVEDGVPVTPHTVFRLGSVTKHLCATLVLMLHDDGRLDVDAPVARYIPEMPRCARTMTLRNLLTMTSGFHDGVALTIFSGSTQLALPRDQHLELVSRYERLMFEPGTQMVYSNTNYMLLSLVIERVTGRPLREVSEQRIFVPLGMGSSRLCERMVETVPHKARGYLPGAEPGSFEAGLMLYELSGDGGVDTTIGDFVRWFQAYRNQTLLGPGYRERMESDVVLPDGGRTGYALGLDVGHHREWRRISHAGGMPGYLADFNFYPEPDLGVLLLANWMDPALLETSDRIADLVLDAAPAARRRRVSEPSVAPGFYVAADAGMALELQAAPEGLVCYLLGERTLLEGGARDGWTPVKRGAGYRIAPQDRPDELSVRFGDGRAIKFVPVPENAAPPPLQDFVGAYRSSLLGETHFVSIGESGRLRVGLDSPLRRLSWGDLVWHCADFFTARVRNEPTETNLVVRFTRDDRGRVTGMGYTTFRCRGVVFSRED